MRKLTYWLVGLVLIGLAIGAVLLLNNIQDISWAAAENAVCEATVADQGGVDINSAFRFTFQGDVSANAVRRFLTVEPAVEFNFHQGVQAREVLAVPIEPLQQGAMYRFTLNTEQEQLSWAFQTKRAWNAEVSRPAHTAVAVEADATLEIYFNQSLAVDMAVAADFLQISPAIQVRLEQEGNCLRLLPEQPLLPDTVYTVRLLAGLPAQGSDTTLAEDMVFAFETAGTASFYWEAAALATVFSLGQAPVFVCQLPETELPKISAELYRYADAETYAAELLERQTSSPLWSRQHRYAQGASTLGMQWLASQESIAQKMSDGSYQFSWAADLTPGCYLLKASYLGVSRDIRFQVSALNATVQAAPEQSSIWVYSNGQLAADCLVSQINSGIQARTDSDGLARLDVEHQTLALDAAGQNVVLQDIYLLRLGEQTLVVQDNSPALLESGPGLRQYLALNKGVYQSGNTLDFWGYMRRLDNDDWQWSRVSVYVYAQGESDEPVAQGFAPLDNNMFHGGLELPCLLSGPYELQIWQSGQMLFAQTFTVENEPASATAGVQEEALPLPPADMFSRSLRVDVGAAAKPKGSAGEQTLSFAVSNTAGSLPGKTGLLVSISQQQGETLFFDTLSLDKNGQASLDISLPAGLWRVQTMALADADQPLFGSATMSVFGMGAATAQVPEIPLPPSADYTAWATRYDMSAEASHFVREGLLFFSSAERVQAMELLWQSLFTLPRQIEQRLSNAYARLLWQSFGYTTFYLPPAAEQESADTLQQADGSVLPTEEGQDALYLSMLTAALAPDGFADIDTFALARYLQGRALGPAPLAEKAMALTGLAALGRPVLQEIKLLLPQTEQDPFSHACLIWGLALAGDLQVAKPAWRDYLGLYALDATSGSLYLEGGQGENISLNRLAAPLAAACGDAHTAIALLQYLRDQGQNDDLTVTLVAGGLLKRLYAPPASATLLLDGRAYTAEISAFSDLWLEHPTPGNVHVEDTIEDLAMTCLRLMK